MLLARSVPPSAPAPPPVRPVPPPEPANWGGGCTTFGVPSAGADDARVPFPPATPSDGGGATTFEPSAVPMPSRIPREFLDGVPAATDGGGATTPVGSDGADPPVSFEFTDGGGGTTSEGPKIRPIKPLMNDPLPD